MLFFKAKSRLRKRFVLLITALFLALLWISLGSNSSENSNSPLTQDVQISPSPEPVPSEAPYSGTMQGSLFVPYWLLPDSASDVQLPPLNDDVALETIMYFGITPHESGIQTDEPGYSNLDAFASATQGSTADRLLTVRMIQEATNTTILRNRSAQIAVIQEAIALAQKYNFDGIILDLEHSVLPTKSVTDNISSFVADFAETTHDQSLTFSLALFGDTFYRFRPYDVATLSEDVDHIYIMAYDFHKSYGTPGPNFPLSRGTLYDYDLNLMINDFLTHTQPENITVLLGAFGYDWSVDNEDRPLKAAEAITLNQARSRFYPECTYRVCTVNQDKTSAEAVARYTDDSGQKHVVWFENEESLHTKTAFLRSKGISGIGFWAFGYY